MICVRCKKRPAVVFVSTGKDSNSPSGYCISCASELGIKPVNDLMEKMGITDKEIDQIYDQMGDFLNEDGDFDISSLGKMSAPRHFRLPDMHRSALSHPGKDGNPRKSH